MFFFHLQMLHTETVQYKYFGTWYKRCSSVLKFSKHSPFELGTQSLEIASLELFANERFRFLGTSSVQLLQAGRVNVDEPNTQLLCTGVNMFLVHIETTTLLGKTLSCEHQFARQIISASCIENALRYYDWQLILFMNIGEIPPTFKINQSLE